MISRHTCALALALPLLTASAQAQSWAIELHDDARLDFPWSSVMNTGATATMEGWFRQVAPMNQQMGFTRYQGSAEHKEFIVRQDGKLAWLYAGQPWAHNGPCRETSPGVFPADGEWHHCAFSRHADNTWEVYVDGQVVHSGGPSGCCWLTCATINAQAPTWISGASGMQLRSFRFSNIDRYAGPFEPSAEWTSDANAAMLLPIEEGAGNVIFDIGIASQTGVINGGYTWVDLSAECVAENFCTGSPNSAGPGASLSMSGTTSVSSNDFTLTASGASVNSSGLFVYSDVQATEPFGDGIRCVGSSPLGVYRLSPTLLTDESGVASRYVDMTLGAPAAGAGAITPGSTWNFQFWYRDLLAGGSGFNATDGLQVTFCP